MNYLHATPVAVMTAQGSRFTSKQVEGYPAKRHYDGCEYVGVEESQGIDPA